MSNWNDGLYFFKTSVRAPFLNLYEPKAFKDPKTGVEGTPKFSATILIPPDSIDLEPMKAVLGKVARAKWPTREFGTLKFPLVNGQTLIDAALAKGKGDGAIYAGMIVMAPRTAKQPMLDVFENGKITRLETDQQKAQYKSKFYGGCYVVPTIHFTPYEGFGGGVTAYLQTICWVKDGPRVGGIDVATAYKDFVGHVTDFDPKSGGGANMDDEIPF